MVLNGGGTRRAVRTISDHRFSTSQKTAGSLSPSLDIGSRAPSKSNLFISYTIVPNSHLRSGAPFHPCIWTSSACPGSPRSSPPSGRPHWSCGWWHHKISTAEQNGCRCSSIRAVQDDSRGFIAPLIEGQYASGPTICVRR